MEVSLCSDIQYGAESNFSTLNSGTKSSDTISEKQLDLVQVHCSDKVPITAASQEITGDKIPSISTLNKYQPDTDNRRHEDIAPTHSSPPLSINIPLNCVPAVNDASQNDVFSQQTQGKKTLAEISGVMSNFVLTTHSDCVDGSCQLPSKVEENFNGKTCQPEDVKSLPLLKALSLAGCKDGNIQESSRLSVDVDSSPHGEEHSMCKVNNEHKKEPMESMSNSYVPQISFLQVNKKLSTSVSSDGECHEVSSQVGPVPKLPDQEPRDTTTDSCWDVSGTKTNFKSTTKKVDLDNCKDKDEFLEQDPPVALWVKWRGKWQTGIQCLKEDFPLQTLKAKPRHERKKYVSIFFPHARTFGWADRQLVCSIDTLPEPLASGTHESWLELVKDLSAPRLFVMQKLAVSMLDISDKLHTEAVTQSARAASFWKEFAKEASCCKSYSELGMMLLKLQRMILPRYINSEWLKYSLISWEQQCQRAETAESVELLTKELANSLIWSNVEELWNAPVQPELGSEWKMWKQEAMQLFTASLPSFNGDVERDGSDNSASFDSQRSAKRPKLEIRRRNMHEAEPEDLEIKMNSEAEDINQTEFRPEHLTSSTCLPQNVADTVIDALAVSQNITNYPDETIANHAHSGNHVGKMRALATDGGPKNKYRRCLAFMEARGKQCGRWASDGSNYCCAHAGSSANSNASKERPIKAIMCMGTTTHGNKCKHRARYGSSFCKKHHYNSLDILQTDKALESAGAYLERRNGDNDLLDNVSKSNGECSNGILPVQDMQNSFQEDLVQVMIGQTLEEGNCLMNRYELYSALPAPVRADIMQCIGSKPIGDSANDQCQENATRYDMYCEKHLPKFLKRVKGGRTRFISKEVFVNLLRCCSSMNEKIYLHQACEIVHKYMRKTFSHGMGSKGDHLNWLLSEASKNPHVGEYLLKLVSSQRQKIGSLGGSNSHYHNLLSARSKSMATAVEHEGGHPNQSAIMSVKCKVCAEELHDEQALGVHWMNIHKKEAKHLFRGYACAICMNSFTGRKILESHINDKHGVQFLQHSVLFRCMSCNSHFPNPGKLWEHVLSFHSVDFRLPTQLHDQLQPQSTKLKVSNEMYPEGDINGNESGTQSFYCGLCSMQFDLLSDLECHHQAVHLNPTSTSFFPIEREKQHIKTSKRRRPRHKIGLQPSFKRKNPANLYMKKHFQASSSVIAARLRRQTQASESLGLGKLAESHCSAIAERLFAEVRQTKPQPSNSEIISLARSACCATYIHNNLVERYGAPSENSYLRAARFCSELKIPICWHMEDFACPRGCKPLRKPAKLAPLVPLCNDFREHSTTVPDSIDKGSKEMDGCHFVVSPRLLKHNYAVLCEDISFGKELVPISCVIDDDMRHLVDANGGEASHNQGNKDFMPWQGFSYITQRLLDSSLCLDARSSQLGCACRKKCYPGDCDHVYLLNDDYENAEDVNGSSMHGRCPYDKAGRIELKEGYPVYECNSLCHCDRTCQNRVLQNGMQVKLEIFRTDKKGWAVRAREAISRGTFVCEYIGEVINSMEADERAQRCLNSKCKFLFDISALANDLGQLTEAQVHYVIDATNYGNVSRFINYSCSPNLACYLVLVESMECQLAHVGLFARQDIAKGEELAFDHRSTARYRDGCACYCGSMNCRGFL